jgi:toxin ParE1/3/4
LKLRILSVAQAEIDRAAIWYEAQREGLGLRFLDRIDDAIDSIGLNPIGYAKVFGENRRCNVGRFPYTLWFKVEHDAVIVGCLHAKRDIRLAKERARSVVPFPERPEGPV